MPDENYVLPSGHNQKLNAALKAKGDEYRPRTEHLLPDGSPRYTNRLILEDSPYLIQHAHNPVDWYAWSAEAFAKAKRENKPVFLSIGYSTCHWCHVMEQESFDNLEIARFMNQHFVSIKVDRERRPDVDATYMTAVQLLSGRGGWPMSSFLTPDGKTFFGGTYYPPDQFINLLKSMEATWRETQDVVIKQADLISAEVQSYMSTKRKAQVIDRSVIERSIQQILSRYDDIEGGFSDAPKFPNEPILFLLFDAALRYQNKTVMDAMLHSLQAMAKGGIYDQIGGGFHRYSTDPHWLIPHFEKMLYNQANLSRLYIKAYELSGDVMYERVARQTIDYVLREMTSLDGGFYSATDADSEGREGKFFVWTLDQIRETLTPEEASFTIDVFNITQSGNFEGNNILYLPVSLQAYAEQKQLPLNDVIHHLDIVRGKLLIVRDKRIPPLRDEKIITAWNGMMITALANAGYVLNDSHYQDSAIRTAEFIWSNMRNTDNTLWRSYLDGRVSVSASQEDYAYFAEALLAIYDVTGDSLWLDRAKLITKQMLSIFWDSDDHGFYMNADIPDIPIMARPKESFDSAIPSGNSVALRVFAKLVKRTDKIIYQNYATETIAAFSSSIAQHPGAYPYMMMAVSEHLYHEQGKHQYAARGNVIINMTSKVVSDHNQLELTLSLNIRPNWHINADKTLDKDLIPTQIVILDNQSNWNITKVEYPEATIKSLDFSKTKLALFEGQIELKTYLKKDDEKTSDMMNTIPLQVKLQACNDELCLPPEVLIFNISPATIQN